MVALLSLFIAPCFRKFIQLFISSKDRNRQKGGKVVHWYTPQMPATVGVGQAGVGHQELNLDLPHGWEGSDWLSYRCYQPGCVWQKWEQSHDSNPSTLIWDTVVPSTTLLAKSNAAHSPVGICYLAPQLLGHMSISLTCHLSMSALMGNESMGLMTS